MPEPTKPSGPPQEKPLWEYAIGGLLWGAGFFGAALLLRRAFPKKDDDENLPTDELESW